MSCWALFCFFSFFLSLIFLEGGCAGMGGSRREGRGDVQGVTLNLPTVVRREERTEALAWSLGTGKHHSHLPIIIKTMLGCLLNLHNTVPMLLLLLSIMAGMRGWGPLHPLFSVSLCLSFSLWLCLVFICPSTKDWFPTVSPTYVQQIWIFTGWWSTKSTNNKQKTLIQKQREEREREGEVSVCVWLMRRDGCCGVRDSGRYCEESWIRNAVIYLFFFLPVTPCCFSWRGLMEEIWQRRTEDTRCCVFHCC